MKLLMNVLILMFIIALYGIDAYSAFACCWGSVNVLFWLVTIYKSSLNSCTQIKDRLQKPTVQILTFFSPKFRYFV